MGSLLGRKSQLKHLGRSVKVRVTLAAQPVKNVWKAGKLAGEGLRLYRKLKPIEEHIEKDHCPNCSSYFDKIKNCPVILSLPEGSHKEATAHILTGFDKCTTYFMKILECPEYRTKYGDMKHA